MGRDPVTKDMEKAEVLNIFLASVFSTEIGLQESQAPASKGKVWSKEDLTSVEEISDWTICRSHCQPQLCCDSVML